METSVNSDPRPNQDIVVPRLTFNRAFRAPGEMSGYADLKDSVLDVLNDAIAENPDKVLADITSLEDQLASGIPIATRSFIAIKDELGNESKATRRQYSAGTIRDALSITSNGSQFEFGHTHQEHETGWAAVYDKGNDIDRQKIVAAQARIAETQLMVRRYRQEEAKNVPGSEARLGEWETLHTIAKQQRALIRLRSLAVMARGPEFEIPAQATEARVEELAVEPQPKSAVGRAASMLVRAASTFTL